MPTRCAGDGIALATEAVREGAHTVVAAGGDGTVNEVVNGLMDGTRRFEHPPPRLAVLPFGTVNVFAREMLLPSDFDSAWQCVLRGQERVVDVACVDWSGQHRSFVQLAGAGLDAHAISRVRWQLKRRFGSLAYIWAGFESLTHPHPPIQLRGNGETVSGQLILIGNGRYYGGTFPVFHKASLRDGLLDVLVFEKIHLLGLIRTVIASRRGRAVSVRDAIYRQYPTFELLGPAGLPFQLEGDNVGTLPVQFGMEPEPLRVLVP